MVPTVETELPLPGEYIERMKATKQNPRYHAEGSVYNHTLLVLKAFQSHASEFDLTESEQEVLYWAAVLHDIGKPIVTQWKNGRWIAKGHEEAGVPIAHDILLSRPELSPEQREQILALVRWHYIPLRWGLKQVELERYKELSRQIDFRLLGIFSYFDILGRLCERKPAVLSLIRHFNEYIVPLTQSTE